MVQIKLANAATSLYRWILTHLAASVNNADKRAIKSLDRQINFAENLRESVAKLAVKADEIETEANAEYDAKSVEFQTAYREIYSRIPA